MSEKWCGDCRWFAPASGACMLPIPFWAERNTGPLHRIVDPNAGANCRTFEPKPVEIRAVLD